MIAALRAWWYRFQAGQCHAHAKLCLESATIALRRAEDYTAEAYKHERAATRAESCLTA